MLIKLSERLIVNTENVVLVYKELSSYFLVMGDYKSTPIWKEEFDKLTEYLKEID